MPLTREDIIQRLQQAGGPENLNLSGKRFVKGINLAGFDLHGAKLTRTYLNQANLQGANLSGANLKRAWLMRANLQGANLVGVHLGENHLPWAHPGEIKSWLLVGDLLPVLLNHGASLVGANLSGVNLRGLNLEGFDLSNTNLSGADLSGADLKSAKLQKANLNYANLSGAAVSNKQLHRAASLQGAIMPDQMLSAVPAGVSYQQPGYTEFVAQQPYASAQPYPPQPVPQAAGPYGVRVPQRNVLAIVGFVLGLVGLLTSWLLFGALLCIPGGVLSAVGLRRSDNKGLAIAGLALSVIGVAVAITIMVIANLPR